MSEENTTYTKKPIDLEKRFPRDGSLTWKKLLEYMPAMIVTNLSTLLLTSVDGLVLGNFVGKDALSAVNIFYPATLFIGIVSIILGSGASSALSTCMGRNDPEGMNRLKKSVVALLVVLGIFITVVQVPVVYGIITSYHLAPEINSMTWQYAIGIMLATPLGIISTLGVYELQVLGKMKVLMWLTLTEGLANLAFDLLFVAVFHMGAMGASMGTATANLIRCTLTLIYLIKKTDMFRFGKVKLRAAEIKDVLTSGLPEGANSLILALQNYFMMMILFSVFGDDGGVIKGVCVFCFSVVNVFLSGIQGAMRPLTGLLCGADDREGLRTLVKQGIRAMIIAMLVLTLIVELVPGLFYWMNGVKEIPGGGLLCVRLYAIYFMFRGIDTIFRLYFANRKDAAFSTGLTFFGNCTLPAFAWLLSVTVAAPFVWLSYLFTELLIFFLNIWRYRRWAKKDQTEKDPDSYRLYLTVNPDEAIEASRLLRSYADTRGASKRIMNRVSLCMEEMVFYAVKAQKNSKLRVQVEILLSGESARFMMLDDGKCISLDADPEVQTMISDNYDLLKKVASSVQYQYILDMNYSILTF